MKDILNKIKLFDVIKFTPVIALMYISTLWVFKMYKSIWSNAGVYEAIKSIAACVLVGIVILLVTSNLLSIIPYQLNLIASMLIFNLFDWIFKEF